MWIWSIFTLPTLLVLVGNHPDVQAGYDRSRNVAGAGMVHQASTSRLLLGCAMKWSHRRYVRVSRCFKPWTKIRMRYEAFQRQDAKSYAASALEKR